MSDFMADLTSIVGLNGNTGVKLKHGTLEDKTTLDFNDFLTLMVTQLQNQTIDNTMDTSEMMNQMTQMSVMQAITDISTLISQSTSLNYAASLVGKEVTVGRHDENGRLQEIQGVVTGTGTYQGQQVIFIGDDCFYLNSVMAVGKLPDGEINPNAVGSSKPAAAAPEEAVDETPDETDAPPPVNETEESREEEQEEEQEEAGSTVQTGGAE